MGDVINLRQARKAKARQDREDAAKEARSRYGQPKAVTSLEAAREEKSRRDLEAHRLPDSTED